MDMETDAPGLEPPPQGAEAVTQRHSIDSLAFRDNTVFGWGWFLDDESAAVRCELEVPLLSGATQRIACMPSGMREDLKAAFPEVGHASSAGFIIRGRFKEPIDEAAITRLICTLANGQVHVREILGFPSRFVAKWEPRGLARWDHFRQRWTSEGGGPAIAYEWDYLRKRWDCWLDYLGMLMSLRRRKGLILIFDHVMGGGANRYRNDLMARFLTESRPVALVTFRLASLDYILTLRWGDQQLDLVHEHLATLLSQFAIVAISEIHINNLVSFPDPLAVVRWAKSRKSRRSTRLVVHLHDYYPVCPSWTLIDAWGKYCGIPTLDVCRKCLPANSAHTLSLAPEIEVVLWRKEWQGLLDMADSIVGFSGASVDILKTAYPVIDRTRIIVRPHVVDETSLRPVQPVFGQTLVIGVIGHISAAKGALILRDMARLIRWGSRPVRIVVIGTLEHHDAADGIEVTGEYQSSHLPELLEKYKVGICMLPSICAETFSYVTAEIMAMRMPLAVFDLGAPAERARDYDRGLVISRIDAATALDEIQSFADRLGAIPSEASIRRNMH